jgi:hypothetical protein
MAATQSGQLFVTDGEKGLSAALSFIIPASVVRRITIGLHQNPGPKTMVDNPDDKPHRTKAG